MSLVLGSRTSCTHTCNVISVRGKKNNNFSKRELRDLHSSKNFTMEFTKYAKTVYSKINFMKGVTSKMFLWYSNLCLLRFERNKKVRFTGTFYSDWPAHNGLAIISHRKLYSILIPYRHITTIDNFLCTWLYLQLWSYPIRYNHPTPTTPNKLATVGATIFIQRCFCHSFLFTYDCVRVWPAAQYRLGLPIAIDPNWQRLIECVLHIAHVPIWNYVLL